MRSTNNLLSRFEQCTASQLYRNCLMAFSGEPIPRPNPKLDNVYCARDVALGVTDVKLIATIALAGGGKGFELVLAGNERLIVQADQVLYYVEAMA